jgi:hypothetical protein
MCSLISPNGTLLTPLDAIHAAIAPYVNVMRMHVNWKTGPCQYCIAFIGEYQPGWYDCETLRPDRCEGKAIDRYGPSMMTCKLCDGTSVTPIVVLE